MRDFADEIRYEIAMLGYKAAGLVGLEFVY